MNDRSATASQELEAVHQTAVEIVRQAGVMLDELFSGPLDVRFKSKRDKDPVTAADEAIEGLVRQMVAVRFPDHGVLGEEGAGSNLSAGYVWVVDPLDGTANFANGLPAYAASIGVLLYGEPVVAALYSTFGPAGHPCIVHARLDGGLMVDGAVWRPVARTLSGRARLAGVPAGFHYAFSMGLWPRLPRGETRSFGSIAVELALVATGQLQYAVFSSPKIWDVAGGALLVREAGGRVVTDQRGGWSTLTRFDAPPGRSLREWKQAVVAGDQAALEHLLPRLRVRHSPLQIAERLAGPHRSTSVRTAWQRSYAVRHAAQAVARTMVRAANWRPH